jgi:hypothetical protein
LHQEAPQQVVDPVFDRLPSAIASGIPVKDIHLVLMLAFYVEYKICMTGQLLQANIEPQVKQKSDEQQTRWTPYGISLDNVKSPQFACLRCHASIPHCREATGTMYVLLASCQLERNIWSI